MGTRRLNKVVKKFNKPSFLELFKGNKSKNFWYFGVFILIVPSLLFLVYLFDDTSHFEKEPEVSVSSSIEYGNLGNGFDTSIEGFEVEVWESGVIAYYFAFKYPELLKKLII